MSENPYSSIVASQIKERDEEQRAKLRAAAVATEGANPDAHASALRTAREGGWAPGAVAADPKPFEAEAKSRKLEQFALEQPVAAGFVADPNRLPLVSDDLPATSRLTDAVMSVMWGTRQKKRGTATDVALAARMGARTGTAATIESPWELMDMVNRLSANAPLVAAQLALGRKPLLVDTTPTKAPDAVAGTAAEIRLRSKEDYESNASSSMKARDKVRPDTFIGQAGWYLDNPAGLATDAAQSGGYMVTGGAGLGKLTVPVMALTQATDAVNSAKETLREKHPEWSDDQINARAGRAGPIALAFGLIAPRVTGGGGLIERAVSGNMRRQIGREVSSATGPLLMTNRATAGRVAGNIGGEIVSESMEEAGVQAATNIGADDPVMKGVGGAIASAAPLAVGMGGPAAVMEEATLRSEARKQGLVMERANAVLRGASEAAALERITQAAAATKLTERSQEDAEALVEHVRAQMGVDEAPNVYIPASEFATLYQDPTEAAQVVEQLTGNADALAEAGENGDIIVPLTRWVSTVARLPNADQLTRVSRMSVDGMSRKDIDGIDMAKEIEAIEGKPVEIPDDFTALVEQQKQGTLAALVGTGRYTDTEAETMATVFAKMLGTLAWRASKDKTKAGDMLARMMDKHRLTINGQATMPSQQPARPAEQRPSVMFEVAPDPNDVELTDQWNSLDGPAKLEASQSVAEQIIPQLTELFGTTGQFAMQVGGYEGATNPSMALELDDPTNIVEIAKALGHALPQDSMMVVSPVAVEGAEETGVVTIGIPDGTDVGALYDRLWELERDGEKLIGGHTTAHGKMAILNFTSLPTEELAELVNEHLGGEYHVTSERAYAAFPQKEDYGYAGDAQQGAASAGSPVREGVDRVRAEATRLLKEQLGRAAERRVRDSADEGGSGRAGNDEGDGIAGVHGGDGAPNSPRLQGEGGAPNGGTNTLAQQRTLSVPSVTHHTKKVQPDAVTVHVYRLASTVGLTHVDPTMAGSGAAGGERRLFGLGRYGQTNPRAYWYEIGTQPETLISSRAKASYAVTLDNLYDLDNDPRGFAEEAGINSDYMEELITDGGFDGFVKDDPVLGRVVITFGSKKKIPVEKADSMILYQDAQAPDILNSPEFKAWFGDRTIDQLEADYAALEVGGKPATDDGHHIDTDLVRELAPAYVADRSLSQELHPYASALTKELFARALARPVREGKAPVVAFLAGGGGSGKSTATSGEIAALNPDITFDGTLSNIASARRDIEASLEGGKRKVAVMLVYRSPENAAAGVVRRAIRSGRPVPVWALVDAHVKAPLAVKALAKEYDGDDRVQVVAIWNDGAEGSARRIPVEEIPHVDEQAAEKAFTGAVEAARQEPAGQREGLEVAGELGAGRGGQLEQERPRKGGHALSENLYRAFMAPRPTKDPAAGGVSRSGVLYQDGPSVIELTNGLVNTIGLFSAVEMTVRDMVVSGWKKEGGTTAGNEIWSKLKGAGLKKEELENLGLEEYLHPFKGVSAATHEITPAKISSRSEAPDGFAVMRKDFAEIERKNDMLVAELDALKADLAKAVLDMDAARSAVSGVIVDRERASREAAELPPEEMLAKMASFDARLKELNDAFVETEHRVNNLVREIGAAELRIEESDREYIAAQVGVFATKAEAQLALNGSARFTRSQVLNFIREGGVKLEYEENIGGDGVEWDRQADDGPEMWEHIEESMMDDFSSQGRREIVNGNVSWWDWGSWVSDNQDEIREAAGHQEYRVDSEDGEDGATVYVVYDEDDSEIERFDDEDDANRFAHDHNDFVYDVYEAVDAIGASGLIELADTEARDAAADAAEAEYMDDPRYYLRTGGGEYYATGNDREGYELYTNNGHYLGTHYDEDDLTTAVREHEGVSGEVKYRQYLSGGEGFDNYREATFSVAGMDGSYSGGHFDHRDDIIAHALLRDDVLIVDGVRHELSIIIEAQSDLHQDAQNKGHYKGRKDDIKISTKGWVAEDLGDDEWHVHLNNAANKVRRVTAKSGAEAIAIAAEGERNVRLSTVIPYAPYRDTKMWAGLVARKVLADAVESGKTMFAWSDSVSRANNWSYKYLAAYQNVYDIAIKREIESIAKKYRVEIKHIDEQGNAYPERLSQAEVLAKRAELTAQYEEASSAVDGYRPDMTDEEVKAHSEAFAARTAARDALARFERNHGAAIELAKVDESLANLEASLTKLPGFPERGSKDEQMTWIHNSPEARLLQQEAASLIDKRKSLLVKGAPSGLWAMVITPEMRAGLKHTGLTLYQNEGNDSSLYGASSTNPSAKGEIDLSSLPRMAISIFGKADRSTFMHEASHFYLEAMHGMIEDEDVTDEVKADFDRILKFAGVPGSDAATRAAWWKSAPLGDKVQYHERFARSFELYLRTGKAPSRDMIVPFARFKRWLGALYQHIADLLRAGGKELDPEITGVMDRMVAIDEEIDDMATRQGLVPLLPEAEAKKLGLTDKQWEAYVRGIEAATEEARAEVLAKVLAAERSEKRRAGAEAIAKAVERLTAEWKASPAYVAWKRLQDKDDPVFLDADAIKTLYAHDGPEVERLRRMGVYRVEGGVHPDIAAEVLGYSSGDALLRALLDVKDEGAAIPAQAEQEARGAHPELFAEPDTAEAGTRALYGSRRVAVLESELAMLARIVGEPVMNVRQLRAAAAGAIARKTARTLKPNTYLVAERKAARLATEAAAKGDLAEALKHKRDQAQQAMLFSEATKAKDKAEAQIKALRKAAKPKTIERIGKAGKLYVDALLELLEGHELSPVSGKTVERRAALRKWVAAMQADEDDTAVSDALLARVEAEKVVNVADLTMPELAELHEAVSNVLALARLKNTMLSNHDKRTWEEAREALLAAIDSGTPPADRRRKPDADMGLLEAGAKLYGDIMDLALQPETIIEWLDDGETGAWHDYYWNQLENSQADRERLKRMVAAPLQAIMEKQGRADIQRRRQTVDVPGVGRMTINEIISAALNLGTEGNTAKLLGGGFRINGVQQPFTQEHIGAMLSHLTRADCDMIQAIWDATNTLWPEIVKMQESLAGFSPEKVEAKQVTFQTKDGPITLSGGYYPLVGDPLQSDIGTRQQEGQAARLIEGSFTSATTSKGHNEKRTKALYPLLLDYERVISRHVGDVISDLSHRRALKQLLRILSDGEIKGNIVDRFSPVAYQSLMSGLKNAVNDGAVFADLSGNAMMRLANRTMSNTAVMALGFKVSLAFANMGGGAVQGLSRIKARSIVTAAARYDTHMPSSIALIRSLSPMMVARAEAHDIDVGHLLASLRGKHGLRHRIAELAMSVHRTIVPLLENMLWLARYNEAMKRGSPQAEAIRLADKAIRQTQTKHAPKDLSQFEADPRFKVFNLFAGPLYVLNNRLQDAGLRGRLNGAVSTPTEALGTWLAVVIGGQVVFELMMGRGPDDDDDDDVVGADDWALWLAVKAAISPFQAIPLVKSATNMIEQKVTGKRGSARPDPVTSAAETLVKAGEASYDAMDDYLVGEEIDKGKLVTRYGEAVGVGVGLPTKEPLRLGQYLWDVSTGEYTPENPAEAAKYLIYKRED